MKTDISWSRYGLYVHFYPESDVADTIIVDMVFKNGSNKVLSIQAPSVIAQLKAAGCVVRKKREKKHINIENLYFKLKESEQIYFHSFF
jgi:hypothetical protein